MGTGYYAEGRTGTAGKPQGASARKQKKHDNGGEYQMKKFRKALAAMTTAALVLGMTGMTAFAADPSITINSAAVANEAESDTTVYTWYQILEAAIEEDPTQNGATQSEGKVSYFVTTEDRANALKALKMPKNDGTAGDVDMFEVTQVGTSTKWYVALKNESTDASDIETAFKNQLDLTKFTKGTFHQTAVAGNVSSGTVNPGYYYITSSAGMNAVIQTLTAVEIDEKNTFPTITKVVADADKSAQIGDEINYTVTVSVPATATGEILLTDTMSKGLTFKEITSVKDGADADVTYTASDVTTAASGVSTFTITFTAATVKGVAEDGADTITIEYSAILNENAELGVAATEDDGNSNTVNLSYAKVDTDYTYTSVDKTVYTDTQSFTLDKVDGTDKDNDIDTKLTGAIFKLNADGNVVKLVEIAKGETYRVASAAEITAGGDTLVEQITTTGKLITIKGVDGDVTYSLEETKAPTSYNLPDPNTTDVKPATDNTTAVVVKNYKGTVLPSTGGMGTKIFYALGGILVLGAGILLVSRRRAE